MHILCDGEAHSPNNKKTMTQVLVQFRLYCCKKHRRIKRIIIIIKLLAKKMDFCHRFCNIIFTGSSTNWKVFAEAKSEPGLGAEGKADYYTAKGTVVYFKKENCMYTVGISLYLYPFSHAFTIVHLE